MTKIQFTGTATQPHRNRQFLQFNNDQYCMSTYKRPCTRFLSSSENNHLISFKDDFLEKKQNWDFRHNHANSRSLLGDLWDETYHDYNLNKHIDPTALVNGDVTIAELHLAVQLVSKVYL